MKLSIKLNSGLFKVENVPKKLVVIGRSLVCDFVVPDEVLSRRHCQIENVDGKFFITDLSSANGVYLDGRRIPPNTPIPFDLFLPLQIGPLELTVEDSSTLDPYLPIRQKREGSFERHLRNDSKKPAPNKKLEKFKDTNFTLLLSLFTFVGIIAYLGYELLSKESKDENHSISQNVPDKFSNIKDSFLSDQRYQELQKNSSCTTEPEICAELKLSENYGEGVAKHEMDYVIYILESKSLGDEYQRIEEPSKKRSVLTIDTILKTQIFKSFQEKKFPQLHVVLINDTKNPSFVFRFHTKYFTEPGFEVIRLQNSLRILKMVGVNEDFESNSRIVKSKKIH
jgi:hypothetical protein